MQVPAKTSIGSRSISRRVEVSPKPIGRHAIWVGYAFIAPTFVFVLGFSYYPALRALIGAFTQWDGFNAPTWVGLAKSFLL